MSFNVRPWSR